MARKTETKDDTKPKVAPEVDDTTKGEGSGAKPDQKPKDDKPADGGIPAKEEKPKKDKEQGAEGGKSDTKDDKSGGDTPDAGKADAEESKSKDKEDTKPKDKESAESPEIDYAKVRRGTLDTLGEIPFALLISAPLKACVAAQNESYKATLKAMTDMGFWTDDKDQQAAVSVGFEFIHQGKRRKMTVPLITLVPISFLQIDNVSISFKANINSSVRASNVPNLALELARQEQERKEKDSDQGKKSKAKESKKASEPSKQDEGESKSEESGFSWAKAKELGLQLMDIGMDLKERYDQFKKSDYSNKKDSKVTRDSKYSIETTVDFNISASPADMPGGMASILERLNASMDVFDPTGELIVPEEVIDAGGHAYISYRTPRGLFDASEIQCTPSEGVKRIDAEDGVILIFEKEGYYTITAGQKKRIISVAKKAKS